MTCVLGTEYDLPTICLSIIDLWSNFVWCSILFIVKSLTWRRACFCSVSDDSFAKVIDTVDKGIGLLWKFSLRCDFNKCYFMWWWWLNFCKLVAADFFKLLANKSTLMLELKTWLCCHSVPYCNRNSHRNAWHGTCIVAQWWNTMVSDRHGLTSTARIVISSSSRPTRSNSKLSWLS